VAVGALADRFFSFQCDLYNSSPDGGGVLGEPLGAAGRIAKADHRVYDTNHESDEIVAYPLPGE
jgi:hypothetical protein